MLARRSALTVLSAVLLLSGAGPAQADCHALGGLLSGCAGSRPESRPQPPPAPPPEPQPAPGSRSTPTHQPGRRHPSPGPARPAAPPQQPTAAAPAPRPADLAAATAQLLELTNAERRAAGLPSLLPSAPAADIASAHSRSMAARGSIWHNDAYFSAATRRRLAASALGENVAMNASLLDAHRRLMASAGHRANILNPRFGALGVGVAQDARGLLYVTEDFFAPSGGLPAATSAAAPGGSVGPAALAPPGAAAPVITSQAVPSPFKQRAASGSQAAVPPRQPSAGLGLIAALLVAATAGANACTVAAWRRRLCIV